MCNSRFVNFHVTKTQTTVHLFSGLSDKRKKDHSEKNDVIENILDEFDDLIEAIDKQNKKNPNLG